MTAQINPSIGAAYLAEARRRLAACRDRIGHCLGQLDDAQVWWRPRESMNSVANIVLHLCGNLRQWIVAGVGGSPDTRDRPAEFAERTPVPRDELLGRLREAVRQADAVLSAVSGDQLLEARRIQGFDETVLSAVFDSLSHLAGHTQEIVYITRLQLGDAYRFAWVPATPEQGADTAAAADAVFEGGSVDTLRPAPAEGARPGPPLGDYLLELEQEFQDEQDEGKV